MKQYFVAVNTSHVAEFTENCTRTKENRINLFKNIKAPQSAPVFQPENLISISLIFGRIITFYEKMNRAQMKRRKLATILDKSAGTFSYVFFKVLKSFHNQELTFKTLPVR